MIDEIIERTNFYINGMPKEERKKYGQFFTSKETALYMAELLSESVDKDNIEVLDAGAGSGILSCAFVEVMQKKKIVKQINLVCYETDNNIIKLLEGNLDYIKKRLKLILIMRLLQKTILQANILISII